ncbi:MAG: signal peptide peptidase SppA [Nitrospinota bacterium]|jgi:protease-4|nr:signal peptide peptidase SppA [Nitrospinota bacterium]MDP7384824.1 signal peptide peptidase SppA [Nitrospinota bacterium]
MEAPARRKKRRRGGRTVIWTGVLLLLAAGLTMFLVGEKTGGRSAKKVALIRIEGPILTGGRVVRLIERYGEDSAIRALVVQVNSPGGGVAASQEIYHALLRFRDRGKVVLTSMEGVGASGGYYVALASDKIYANAGTITGSIGVILQVGNIEGLLKKAGLKIEVVKSGVHKDVGSPLRPMSAGDRAVFKQVIDDAYTQFVRAVSVGRKMPMEAVRKIADGRIFTGERAKGLGLIDEIGTLEDSIREAGRMAGIKGRPRVHEERRRLRGWIERLLRSIRPAGWVSDALPTVRGLQYIWTYWLVGWRPGLGWERGVPTEIAAAAGRETWRESGGKSV